MRKPIWLGKERRALDEKVRRFVQESFAPIYADGGDRWLDEGAAVNMSTISHDDAASAVAAALNIPSGIYNVVDDEPLTRRALYNAIAQAIGAPPPRFPPAWL